MTLLRNWADGFKGLRMKFCLIIFSRAKGSSK